MNTLVYKYGESAKNNNTGLALRILLDADATNQDREMVSNLTNIVSGNLGSTPVNVDGTVCDDGNPATVGETWLSNTCQGGIVGNLASNGLIYDNCEGGANTYLGAQLYCESKGMRLPLFEETKGSGGILESCPRIPLTWTWTSTYAYGYFYYVWGESTYFYGKSNPPDSNDVYLVRCVK